MSPFVILFLAGLAAALAAMIYIVVSQEKVGSAALAAALSGGFGAFTAITILYEGVLPVWLNHTQNLWGVQVWWDLLISLTIALFFVLPRARAAGMSIFPWLLFVVCTASIGLLAMVARLFWLEKRAEAA
ncbi:hypothetical protein K3162_12820 [Qipengyuania xiapuensis]|uniref:Uncharacterized protein n=1 Tax=Qipengyuania xiapuensis TaxID=2867236 RepID=A0ABX8ZWZ7_9SPHN|nr:hypothetical protein [Qipengyuania xiapuensis]QZD92399.1 hypothetical protein K3162_12820 [Qipengyuania xiapuensis]